MFAAAAVYDRNGCRCRCCCCFLNTHVSLTPDWLIDWLRYIHTYIYIYICQGDQWAGEASAARLSQSFGRCTLQQRMTMNTMAVINIASCHHCCRFCASPLIVLLSWLSLLLVMLLRATTSTAEKENVAQPLLWQFWAAAVHRSQTYARTKSWRVIICTDGPVGLEMPLTVSNINILEMYDDRWGISMEYLPDVPRVTEWNLVCMIHEISICTPLSDLESSRFDFQGGRQQRPISCYNIVLHLMSMWRVADLAKFHQSLSTMRSPMYQAPE